MNFVFEKCSEHLIHLILYKSVSYSVGIMQNSEIKSFELNDDEFLKEIQNDEPISRHNFLRPKSNHLMNARDNNNCLHIYS